jgi:hypothetical protein
MPYIKRDRRDVINAQDMKILSYDDIDSAGEIQYAIAVILKSYMERKDLTYQNCNDVVGALAGAQMEYYRKVVGPYESEKELENGSV